MAFCNTCEFTPSTCEFIGTWRGFKGTKKAILKKFIFSGKKPPIKKIISAAKPFTDAWNKIKALALKEYEEKGGDLDKLK